MYLNPLSIRIIGRLTFHCVSGIHIGIKGEGMHKPALKVNDMLLIPATSWKGSFRAISERVINAMTLDGVEGLLRKLYVEDEDGIGFKSRGYETREFDNLLGYIKSRHEEVLKIMEQLVLGNDEVMTMLREIKSSEELKSFVSSNRVGMSLLQRYLGMIYPITSLYGSQGVAGKVRFMDTIVKADVSWRPGVGIDRMTMRSDEGKLYSYEVLVPNSGEVVLRLIIDNVYPKTLEAKVLSATLRLIKKDGIQIGGSKSRGIGHMVLKEERSWFRVMDVSNKVDLATKVRLIASPKNGNLMSFNDFLTSLSI